MNRLLILDSDGSNYKMEIDRWCLPDLEITVAENQAQAEPYLSTANIIFGTPALVAGIVDHLFVPSELPDFLPQLDYLVLVLPDTEMSRDFITGKELRLMKPEAVLINVGRGSSVNQQDLIAALESASIGGAVLDVFEQEPLPEDSPLWSMEQVLITPHNSAYSFPNQVTEIFCANYNRFISGSPLNFIVDFNRGY